MKVMFRGNSVSSLQQWEAAFTALKKPHHWKPGRSAFELAALVLRDQQSSTNRGVVTVAIHAAIGAPCKLDEARIEWETQFDGARAGPRSHDLGIFGSCNGSELFVGLEAKVDEGFGDGTVAYVWAQAQKKLASGGATYAPQRIQQLVDAFLPGQNPATCQIPYQLLTAAAGTLAEGCKISLLHVIVFVSSPNYNNVLGAANRAGFELFLNAVGAKPRSSSSGALQVYELPSVAGPREGSSSLSQDVFNRKLHIIWQEV
jgi:hypothetical protein